MAVAIIRTDNWLSHLEFTGGRRQTEFGPIDGLFYGLLAGDGDAGGGNFTLNGLVSFDRKEDWVYILKSVSATFNTATLSQDAFVVASTGPVIPTDAVATTVSNPSFHYGGGMAAVSGNAITLLNTNSAGSSPLIDIPIFGDKKLTGPLALIACGHETNVDGQTYQLSVYGWLIRYSSFFRNLSGSFG